MLHWVESEDEKGLATWLRFIECSHWGLFLTAIQPRYLYAGQLRKWWPRDVT